jgi:hypothetical protein
MASWSPDGKNRMFRVEGMEDLEAKLSELMDIHRADTAARATIVKAAKDAMSPVADQVRSTAPYDPSPRTEKSPIHLRDTVRLDARIPTKRDLQSIYVSQSDAAIAVVSVKPKPFMTKGSVIVSALAPLNSIAAVLDTVVFELAVPAVALPNASLFLTCNTPFVTVVAP